MSPCLFNYMQGPSWETLGWTKHRLESRFLVEISITSDMQMTLKESESEMAQLCPTPYESMDGSLPVSTIHGTFQAKTLKRAAISFSRGSSQPRDRTQSPALQTDAFPSEPWHYPCTESEELKSLLMKMKEESEKIGLKLKIQRTQITASDPITSLEIDGETVETGADFIFGASKITCRWW